MLTPLPLNREEDARRLIGLWAKVAPGILPDRVGTYEPLRREFSIDDLDDVLAEWECHVLFKRVAKPKLQSSVLMQYGPHRRHSSWAMSVHEGERLSPILKEVLVSSAIRFNADFGFVHVPAAVDLDCGIASNSLFFSGQSRKNGNVFVTTHLLRKYLPDLYWVTLFGKPYVDLFSKERLMSAPAYRVQEIEGGAVLLQVSEHIDDPISNGDAFQARRRGIKEHLDGNAFFELSKGVNYQYLVPNFNWTNVSH